ncbi:MAG: GNAT family N-acetyltransferase [Flavobacteriales bacterium]|nr:GNAT family N-acetyltransferase [Flavobacteriales bacterium]
MGQWGFEVNQSSTGGNGSGHGGGPQPPGTGSITGTVADMATAFGISGATVEVNALGVSATTDAMGKFTLPNIPYGTYTVKVSATGYLMQEVPVTVSSEMQPNMTSTIRPDWQDFDSVMNDFSSKYRVRAKAAIKKAEHLTLREFSVDDIQQHNDTIMQLFKNVEAGADFHMVSIHPRYFLDLKAALDDHFVVKGFFDGEKLIGFYSYIRGFEHSYASFVGLNYDYNQDCSLYQNILYHLLDDAIKDGAKSIDLARTAMEIKSTMGAEPVDHHLMIKHLNSITNSILKRFITNIRPKEWTQRNPFKEA